MHTTMSYLIPPSRILSIFSCLARVSKRATHDLSISSYPMLHTVDCRTPATVKADTIRLARLEDLLRDEQMDQVDPSSPLPSLQRRYPLSLRVPKRVRHYPGMYQEDPPSPAADPSTPTDDEATATTPKASVSDAKVVRLARRSAIHMRSNPHMYQEDGPSPTVDPSTPTVDEATASLPKASVSDASAVRLARRSAKRMRHNPSVYQKDCPSSAADPSTPTGVEATASSPKASVSDADAVRLARSMAQTQSVEPSPSESTTAEPLAKATEGSTPPAATSDHDSSRCPLRSLSAKRMARFSLW